MKRCVSSAKFKEKTTISSFGFFLACLFPLLYYPFFHLLSHWNWTNERLNSVEVELDKLNFFLHIVNKNFNQNSILNFFNLPHKGMFQPLVCFLNWKKKSIFNLNIQLFCDILNYIRTHTRAHARKIIKKVEMTYIDVVDLNKMKIYFCLGKFPIYLYHFVEISFVYFNAKL
jgi:hypothetical protein